MQVIDLENLNTRNNKIFFGEYSGFQRYDKPSYPSAVKLEESMRGAFWNPNEISMRDDAVKFHQMPVPVQETMMAVLSYQTLMDSTQNRGIEETIVDFVTNPEFEALFKTWGYFEMIHSLSYSHIIRGIFADSVDVFERNMQNKSIIDRIRTEAEKYNDLAARIEELEGSKGLTEENIKTVIELILTIYALEGIKFYASFLYTYLIHDRYGSIPGATRIIKLINFDEDTHTAASVVLLKELTEDPDFQPYIQSEWFADTAQAVFSRVIEDEKSFAEYLRGILGEYSPISTENSNNFLECYVDRRLNALGVPGIFGETPSTPIVDWFDAFKDLNKDNSALQESDIAVYNIGVMQDDL